MLLTQIALAFHLCNLSFGFSPHSFFLAFCVIIHIHRMNFSVLFFFVCSLPRWPEGGAAAAALRAQSKKQQSSYLFCCTVFVVLLAFSAAVFRAFSSSFFSQRNFVVCFCFNLNEKAFRA